MQARLRTWLRYAVSLALAVGILTFLFCYKFDWETLVQNIATASFWPVAGAVGVAGAYWLLRVTRWRWMTSLEGPQVTRRQGWLSMLAGLGIGLVTPMRSGEVVRAAFVPKGARVRLASWIIVERMFDLSAVLVLCVVGVFYMVFGGGVKFLGEEALPPWMLLIVPPLLAAALGVPLLVHYRPRRIWSVLLRMLPGKARQLARTRLGWRQFGIFFAYSLASATLSVLAVFLCLRAYSDIGLLSVMMLTPFVMLNNLLPATPGGFGVREGLAVLIFGAFGYPREKVLPAYVTNALIVLVGPGALGVVWAWIAGVASQLMKARPLAEAAEDAGREPPGA